MAKRRGKSRGKKISFGPKGKISVRKKPTKRQKFVSKISRDGKISKREGQKAARKGVSLCKIQNRNIGDYRQSTRDYERTPSIRRGSSRPTYEPLKIKRGAAEALLGRGRASSSRRDRNQGRGRGGGGGGGETQAPYQSPFADKISDLETKLQGYMDQPTPEDTSVQDALDALNTTISGLNFEAPDYGAELEAMRAEQARMMEEYAARQEEAERQRELAFKTYQENAARGGLTPDFRIGARSPRDQMGTGGFKRRPRRRETVAQGIAPTTAGLTINI